MNKSGKTLINFNVMNGQYAIGDVIKPLTWLTNVNKEKNLDTKTIYGDGRSQISVVNDKGMTGTITTTGRDVEYGIDLGFAMVLLGGEVAEVQQIKSVVHSLYFECYDLIKLATGDEFKQVTGKVWLYGVTASAPSETLSQNTDGINENPVDYAIVYNGTKLMDSTGLAVFKDEFGNELQVWSIKSLPGDANFDDFEKTVPVPKAPAVVRR